MKIITVKSGDREIDIDATHWDCSGNGLKLLLENEVVAMFQTWDYWYITVEENES